MEKHWEADQDFPSDIYSEPDVDTYRAVLTDVLRTCLRQPRNFSPAIIRLMDNKLPLRSDVQRTNILDTIWAFGPFFTWVYHAEDAAVTSLDNFEKMDTTVTMYQLKFLQGLYEPSLLQRVAPDISRPKTNIKEIQDRASAYQKHQWINWHWGAAPDSVIHLTQSMFPSQGSRQPFTCLQR